MFKAKFAVVATAALSLVACGTPTSIRVADSSRRTMHDKTGWTDRGTIHNCISNMINASPADEAVELATRHVGTGKTITVDVDATLVDVGMFGARKPVTYRCVFQGGIMTKGVWTRGLAVPGAAKSS